MRFRWAVRRAIPRRLLGVTGTAGGTVEYRFYGSLAACETDVAAFPGTPPPGGTLVSTVTVTGGTVPPSASATFPAAGTFYWAAFYSGDPSNAAAASDCASEPLVVTAAASVVTTQLSATGGEIPVGGTASDAATLAGVTGAAGGIGGVPVLRVAVGLRAATWRRSPAPRRRAARWCRPRPVTAGTVPQSAVATFPAAGTFYWAAFYSGDAEQPGGRQPCVTEPLVVTPAPSQVTTQLSAAGGEIAVGGSASDTATLAGVTGTAGGRWSTGSTGRWRRARRDVAAFPGTGPSGGTLVSTVTVTGGVVPPSAAHTFGAAGTFYWAAFYSGDREQPGGRQPMRHRAAGRHPGAIAGDHGAVGHRRGDPGRRVGERRRDAAGVTGTAGGRWRTGSTGRWRRASTDVAAFPGTAPSGGTLVSTETGNRRRGAGVGRAHVRRRGHLLLGRVLLRRCRRPGGRQHLRHRAAGGHAGRATACLGHRPHGLGDRRRAAARAQARIRTSRPACRSSPLYPAGRARDLGAGTVRLLRRAGHPDRRDRCRGTARVLAYGRGAPGNAHAHAAKERVPGHGHGDLRHAVARSRGRHAPDAGQADQQPVLDDATRCR